MNIINKKSQFSNEILVEEESSTKSISQNQTDLTTQSKWKGEGRRMDFVLRIELFFELRDSPFLVVEKYFES
jgi:hypothetical protein